MLYSENKTSTLRDILIKLNMDLARKCAFENKSNASSSNADFEDISQQAYLGLIAAVDRYDPNQGKAFSSFAIPTIDGKIKQYIRDKSHTVRIPQSIQNLYIEICRYRKTCNQEPSVKQMALHFQVAESKIQEAMGYHKATSCQWEEADLSVASRNISYSNQEEVIEKFLNLGLKDNELWNKINEATTKK